MRYVGVVAVAVAVLSLMQAVVEVILWAMEPTADDRSRFKNGQHSEDEVMSMKMLCAIVFYFGLLVIAYGLSLWSVATSCIFIGFVLVVMSLAAYKDAGSEKQHKP